MTLLESLTTAASTQEIRVIHDSVYSYKIRYQCSASSEAAVDRVGRTECSWWLVSGVLVPEGLARIAVCIRDDVSVEQRPR